MSGAAPARKVAAFDFDGTLSRRDTLVPFLVRAAGRRRFATAAARVGVTGARRRVDLRDRDGVKEALLAALFAGRPEEHLRELGEQHARDLLANDLRPAVLERLHRHRGLGHDVVFVSASLVYYLEPLARELDVQAVMAVEPEVANGVLTGALARPNVRAGEKAVRLREWLRAPAEGPVDGVELWAYGNSSGDHQLLAMADHAVWLGRPAATPSGSAPFPAGDPTPGGRSVDG